MTGRARIANFAAVFRLNDEITIHVFDCAFAAEQMVFFAKTVRAGLSAWRHGSAALAAKVSTGSGRFRTSFRMLRLDEVWALIEWSKRESHGETAEH